MKIITLDQRSADWHTWRAAGLGSSDAAKIAGLSPYGNAKKVWEAKIAILEGRIPEHTPDNSAMARGRRLEPLIIGMYNDKYKARMVPVCVIHDTLDWCRASLDGYDARLDRVIEIKAPGHDDHEGALDGLVPTKYLPQLYHQMLVTGCKEIDYVSYSDYFPLANMFAVVRLERGKELENIQAIEEMETEFWRWVLARHWPEDPPPETAAKKPRGRPKKV